MNHDSRRCVPAAPARIDAATVHLRRLANGSVAVVWARPRPPNGPLHQYVVSYRLLADADADADADGAPAGNETAPGHRPSVCLTVQCRGRRYGRISVDVTALNRAGGRDLAGVRSEATSIAICVAVDGGSRVVALAVAGGAVFNCPRRKPGRDLEEFHNQFFFRLLSIETNNVVVLQSSVTITR